MNTTTRRIAFRAPVLRPRLPHAIPQPVQAQEEQDAAFEACFRRLQGDGRSTATERI
jgi:hypothetical protein